MSKHKIKRVILCAVFFIAISLRSIVSGQAIVGTVTGIVTDSHGAVVSGAKVTLVNVQTNEAREFSTDSSGAYNFASLPPGTYRVTISDEGFSQFQSNDVDVKQGATARMDAQLQVGAASQTISVIATQTALQTDSGEVRGELDIRQLSSLPVPAGRNYESTLVLIPGVTPPANAQSVAANPARGLQFNTNGAMSNTNNVRIDGAAANNPWLPHVAAYSPGLEAIESVEVVTNSYDAQQGLAGGASVNVHVRTGSNQLHGSAFEFHTDNALTAKPYFLPSIYPRKPKDVDNVVGGTLGGPAKKDRIFYFGSFEGHLISQIASPGALSVPTQAMRNGDFSGSSTQLYDPHTGNSTTGAGKTPLTKNQVPQAEQDKIALAIQQHIPLPNLAGTANNYYAQGPYTLSTYHYDANVTSPVTSKLYLGGRMGAQHFSDFDAPAFGDNGVPVSSAGGRQGNSFGTVWNGTASGSYVAKPSLVFDGYFGVTVINTNSVPVGTDQNTGLNLGIPNTNGPTQDYGGWPYFNVSNFSAIGVNNGPIHYADREYQAQGAVNWNHAKHNVRFGGNISRQIISHFEASTAAPAGALTFTGGATSIPGGPATNLYNSYADFLLGYNNGGTAERLTDNNRLVGKDWVYSLFAQDQWLASDRMTVNYGLRWDYFPIGERQNRGIERFIFSNNTMEICGVAGNPHNCGYKVSLLNFSPSIGLAFKALPTFVVRAGAGLNLDPYPLTYMRDMVTNFPEDLTASLSSPNSTSTVNTMEAGLPVVTPFNLSSGFVNVPGNYTVRTLPSTTIRRSYVETWNLSVEKQWTNSLMAQVRYVGLQQLQISSLLNINSATPGTGAAGEAYNTAAYNNRTSALYLITPVGRNNYNALQAQLREQASRNYTFTVGYTFSKAFAYCCDSIAGETVSVNAPGYLNANRALATFDRPHVFTISTNAASPFGRGQKWLSGRVSSAALGGWQLNGIFIASSGTPFTISASGTSLNAPGSSQQADRVKNGHCALGTYHPSYVDATCFASVTSVGFGTSGFESVRGPGLENLNASLFRTFPLGTERALEFRAEVFNVQNTPHFSNPGTLNISNVSFNPDHSVANLNGFGALTGTNARDQEGIDQRQIRVGAKVTF